MLLYRLTLTGIIVIIFFELGILYFIFKPEPETQLATLKVHAAALNQAAKSDVKLIFDDQTIILPKNIIAGWLESYTRAYSNKEDLRLSSSKITTYLEKLAEKYSSEASNARLGYQDGKIIIIKSSRSGKKIDVSASALAIRRGLHRSDTNISLATIDTEPKISLENIKKIGITDQIAVGESDFVGSSPARVQNIKVAAAKYDGLIIEPNQEFSFNEYLGEVEAGFGWAPEKVIKQNKLVYEYGGGICQVSTTVFRSAILSGLPILQRRPHSFPVRYYNPQGFDATVYPGVQDLKFKNDTDAPILFQTHIVGTKLFVEMYGSKNGRKITLSGPFEYEKNPDGSLKAMFTREISYVDGTNKKENFYSNYKSPALYPLEEPNPLE